MVAGEETKVEVNTDLNPFCNGVVISINAGVDVIFEMLGCRNQRMLENVNVSAKVANLS